MALVQYRTWSRDAQTWHAYAKDIVHTTAVPEDVNLDMSPLADGTLAVSRSDHWEYVDTLADVGLLVRRCYGPSTFGHVDFCKVER